MMIHADLQIQGMSCRHCVMGVREELQKLEGVVVRDVSVGSASIDYDEALVPRRVIESAVKEAGYTITSWSRQQHPAGTGETAGDR